jgi:hypothetical protein
MPAPRLCGMLLNVAKPRSLRVLTNRRAHARTFRCGVTSAPRWIFFVRPSAGEVGREQECNPRGIHRTVSAKRWTVGIAPLDG